MLSDLRLQLDCAVLACTARWTLSMRWTKWIRMSKNQSKSSIRPIISEPYLRGQHNLYAMKQINKKRDPLSCSEFRCFHTASGKGKEPFGVVATRKLRTSVDPSSPHLPLSIMSLTLVVRAFVIQVSWCCMLLWNMDLKCLRAHKHEDSDAELTRGSFPPLPRPSIVALTECTLPGFQMTYWTRF